MTGDAAAAAAAAWRHESTRVVAALVRITRDLDVAEDAAQDAMVSALRQWPVEGIPDNPGAWLVSVAKRRALDQLRRQETRRRLVDRLGRQAPPPDDLSEHIDRIDDDVLRLVFLTCHPAVSVQGRTALTLRLVCGLTTAEIARSYFVKEATVAQRVTRAKRTLAEHPEAFELPGEPERAERLDDVMRVVYLIFNEGYSATAGEDWLRPDLCFEALRLSRLLAALVPHESEVHGLQALLEIQSSRTRARTDAAGDPVLLEQQDRRLWDRLLVERGTVALERAEALRQPVGPYVLQAAIAVTHARARRPEDTDWVRIAELYDLLSRVAPGPVVEVNRAVAHGRAYGPAAGLAILEPLQADPVMSASHLLPAARGELLERSGQPEAASSAFSDAAALTRNERERRLLTWRADALRSDAGAMAAD